MDSEPVGPALSLRLEDIETVSVEGLTWRPRALAAAARRDEELVSIRDELG